MAMPSSTACSRCGPGVKDYRAGNETEVLAGNGPLALRQPSGERPDCGLRVLRGSKGMKAAVVREFKQPLVIEDRPIQNQEMTRSW